MSAVRGSAESTSSWQPRIEATVVAIALTMWSMAWWVLISPLGHSGSADCSAITAGRPPGEPGRAGGQGPQPFGGGIAAGACGCRDLVEGGVDGPEGRAHDVPVGLLGGGAQGDGIDEHRLEVLPQSIRGDEAGFGVLSRCLLRS